MKKRLFGTDGIRGIANVYPMTGEVAFRIGRAAAHIFIRNARNSRVHVVIGKDTRQSGYMLESALTSGICSMGVDVILTGPAPTSAISYLTHEFQCDGGVVISASHNPASDNGIKIVGADGLKLSDGVEHEIEDLVLSGAIDDIRPTGASIGKALKAEDSRERYVEMLVRTFGQQRSLKGMRIVVDCAHGAAYRTAPMVFEALGARLIPLAVEPDGMNINDHVGSCHPELMAETVRQMKADFGLALDGDADRAILCDEKGMVLDGDYILAICGRHLAEKDQLPGLNIVTTVMCNLGLDLALKPLKVNVVKTDVGDRYVSEMMRKLGAVLGGEQSGHIIFSRYFPFGDGTLTALRILEIMCETGKPLSELAAPMKKYPQVLVNVPVCKRCDLMTYPNIRAAIEQAETVLAGDGRVLIRFSGTQALVRIMLEGIEESVIRELATTIADTIEQTIGVSPKGDSRNEHPTQLTCTS